MEVKLADLGLSHFKRVVKLDKRIVDSDIGGTKDYGLVFPKSLYEISYANMLERCARVPPE